ncbi:hypothetical protein U1Q18_015858 [Sarracenia purpurea var. burkii]
MLVGPPREAHRMTNKEPGHLRIELPGFNVLNCKHLRDIIFQLPQVRKRQSHIQLRKNTGPAMHRSIRPRIPHCTGLEFTLISGACLKTPHTY